MLYYNAFCSRDVDRKPEYLGKNIRFCHEKPERIEKIDKILADIRAGKRKSFYYEAVRNANKLGVTVSPFEIDGERVGFIQSFVVLT